MPRQYELREGSEFEVKGLQEVLECSDFTDDEIVAICTLPENETLRIESSPGIMEFTIKRVS